MKGKENARLETQDPWEPSLIRVFLSHSSIIMKEAFQLKTALQAYGVSCFVAHKDIKPSEEWQKVIELALSSMHIMVPLISKDFHASYWTDQEVGAAIGRGVPIIPVKYGVDPYGFIGKLQAVNGNHKTAENLAKELYDVIQKNEIQKDYNTRSTLDALYEMSKKFRHDRLSKVRTFDFPLPCLYDGPKVVIHLIPISQLTHFNAKDFLPIGKQLEEKSPLNADISSGWSGRANEQGYLIHSRLRHYEIKEIDPSAKYHMFLQLFRDNAIEVVESALLFQSDEPKRIMYYFYRIIIQAFDNYLEVLRNNQITLPIIAMISLIGIEGYRLDVRNTIPGQNIPVGKNELLLPMFDINSFDSKAEILLKNSFDYLWQVFGFDSCQHYNHEGRFTEQLI